MKLLGNDLVNFLVILYLSVVASQVSCNLIFANSKDLRMVNLDSIGMETSVIVDNLGDATALDFYYKEQIVFWSDLGIEKIQGVRLGNNKERKPFEVIVNGLSSPDGLAFDWLTYKLYWVDSDTKRMEVCQLDSQYSGTQRKALFSKDMDAPRGIALVPQEGILFWTDWGDKPKIERASMDGRHRRILANEEVDWPNGLAADYDSRRIYWVDAKKKFISSVDYNGNNKKKLISNLPHAYGLTLDKEWLYTTDWTNMGISSCNKESEKCQLLLPILKHQTNQLQPMGIKVFSPHLQPDNVTGCDINNGGCSHLCLLSSESPYYSCACPTGIILTNDNKTCAKSEEKFIVLLRRTDIRKISLDTDDHADVVLPFPKEIKHAISIDYDPIDGRIYWTDDDAMTIRRAFLNSSQFENIVSSDLKNPDGIAIDWIARNLFFTDTGTNSIQVTRLDGSYRKTLISTNLDEPRGIVVNPWKALIFWTDWGAEPKIERACLDGSMRQKIVEEDLAWPNGLALDLIDERIFWGDAKMDRIESCDFNGDSRKLLLDRVSHPFGLTILDDYVYWTDWHERALHRTDKRVGGKREVFVDALPDMMGLKAVYIHQDLGLDLDLGCSKFNGGCKQLCLDRHQKPYTCSCANGWELDFDYKSCKRIRHSTPFPNIDRKAPGPPATPTIRTPCPTDRVACISGVIDCVSRSLLCDGYTDCTDGSDEANCCPPGKIFCPSSPNLCLELHTLCGKYSPCTYLTTEMLELCAKASTSSPLSSWAPISSSISSSSQSSSSLSSAASTPTSSVNELTSNSGFPIIGVVAATVIVVLLCCFAFRMTSSAVHQPVIKKQSLGIPLMQHNQSNSEHGSQCLEVRISPQSYTPQPFIPISMSSPPPDLLSDSNLDSGRCEISSLSGIESVGPLYPRAPPPSLVSQSS